MNRSRQELLEQLRDENPEALLADGFEDALVGLAHRNSQPVLAVYSVTKAAQVLQNRDGLTESEAEEYLAHNVLCAWAGKHSPVWLYT